MCAREYAVSTHGTAAKRKPAFAKIIERKADRLSYCLVVFPCIVVYIDVKNDPRFLIFRHVQYLLLKKCASSASCRKPVDRNMIENLAFYGCFFNKNILNDNIAGFSLIVLFGKAKKAFYRFIHFANRQTVSLFASLIQSIFKLLPCFCFQCLLKRKNIVEDGFCLLP